MGFLLDYCRHRLLTRDLLASCQPFHCGDEDLDEFFSTDAPLYHDARMCKSYCFTLISDPTVIVCAYSLSNDSVNVRHLPNARKKKVNTDIDSSKRMNRYPALLIGRLAVSIDFSNKGIGSELLSIIKRLAVMQDNLSDFRFLAVDAKNEDMPLHYYEKNRFTYLYSTEKQESEHTKLDLPLKTRFMFFDLMNLSAQQEGNVNTM